MEPLHLAVTLPLLALATSLLCLVLVEKGRIRTAAAGFVLACVLVGVGYYVLATDDTPRWGERLESKYGVEISETPGADSAKPGAWEIGGEWRTCYVEDFKMNRSAEDPGTLLCQPVTLDAGFVEVDNPKIG